jgi:hypothetical protein
MTFPTGLSVVWGAFSGQALVEIRPEYFHKEIRLVPTPEKPQGPASYFPSIEKKYGQPIAHWLALLKSCDGMKHMEIVAWLKTEHGMGHGHANAIVAYWMAAKK